VMVAGTAVGALACAQRRPVQPVPWPTNANSPQTAQVPQTVDQVIARNIEARGGLAKIRSVESERLDGQIRIGPGAQGPVTVEVKRPNHMRMEMTLGNRTILRGYDGRTGWTVNPFAANPSVQPMSAEDTQNIATEADIVGPLIDYAAKGNRVELVSLDSIGDRASYKLTVTFPSGQADSYYIDATTFLQARWQGERVINGQPAMLESVFSDYRPVNGVMFPFRVASRARGAAQTQELVFETISVNVAEPDSRFAAPDSPAGK
jgi:hypothetical protein